MLLLAAGVNVELSDALQVVQVVSVSPPLVTVVVEVRTVVVDVNVIVVSAPTKACNRKCAARARTVVTTCTILTRMFPRMRHSSQLKAVYEAKEASALAREAVWSWLSFLRGSKDECKHVAWNLSLYIIRRCAAVLCYMPKTCLARSHAHSLKCGCLESNVRLRGEANVSDLRMSQS